MSGRVTDKIRRSAMHFKNKLIENRYKVIPPPPVPPHIVKPQYAINPRQP